MCGIAGIFASKTDRGCIEAMIQTLHHRGPDAQSVFKSDDKTIALGHTRLRVIDLSSAANQPMHSADGNLTIVFNGEIYNFKSLRRKISEVKPSVAFKTNSDTETILHAFLLWREKMVNRLEGMFAMAIYDRNAKALFLFRDRLGKKPLFYFEDHENFVFASELKALKKNSIVEKNLEINQNGIHRFLHLGYIPEPETIYSKVKKFPAGHWAVKHAGSEIKIEEYWNPINFKSNTHSIFNVENVKRDLKGELINSVQRRLISDVSVGAFLSGGTDSSLVTAIASRFHNGPLKTFSIGFEESKYDEGKYAGQVAAHLKTDHHSFMLREENALEIMNDYLNHFDEPFADTSAIPTMLVSSLARKYVTVALTGDGGDELFMGYGAYNWARRLSSPFIRTIQNPVSVLLKMFGSDRLKRISKILEKVDSGKLASHIFSQEQYFFSDRELRTLIVNPSSYSSFQYLNSLQISPTEQQALFDLRYYLKDDLLVKVDRASMFHSIECRCPLLDHHIVEYALQLPQQFKWNGGERKWILKELLKEFLPDNLIYRPKWGFSVPLPRWLRGSLSYYFDDYLNERLVDDIGLVNNCEVKQLVRKFRNGEEHLYNRLWVLIVIHKWLKENG